MNVVTYITKHSIDLHSTQTALASSNLAVGAVVKAQSAMTSLWKVPRKEAERREKEKVPPLDYGASSTTSVNNDDDRRSTVAGARHFCSNQLRRMRPVLFFLLGLVVVALLVYLVMYVVATCPKYEYRIEEWGKWRTCRPCKNKDQMVPGHIKTYKWRGKVQVDSEVCQDRYICAPEDSTLGVDTLHCHNHPDGTQTLGDCMSTCGFPVPDPGGSGSGEWGLEDESIT